MMSTRVLLVEPDGAVRERLRSVAGRFGHVDGDAAFPVAREHLLSNPYDWVMTNIRLAAYNGLHLATRSRCHCPSRPVIVTHGSFDPVLDMYARSLDVPFIVKPLDNPEFLRHVRAVLDESRRTELMA